MRLCEHIFVASFNIYIKSNNNENENKIMKTSLKWWLRINIFTHTREARTDKTNENTNTKPQSPDVCHLQLCRLAKKMNRRMFLTILHVFILITCSQLYANSSLSNAYVLLALFATCLAGIFYFHYIVCFLQQQKQIKSWSRRLRLSRSCHGLCVLVARRPRQSVVDIRATSTRTSAAAAAATQWQWES